MGKQPVPVQSADLYPEITSFQLDENLSKVLRQRGQNPSKLQSEIDTAIQTGDYAKKAQLLEGYSSLTDKVLGNNASSSYLRSRRVMLPGEAPAPASVSKTQAFLGLTGDGFVDLAESLPKLAVAAYHGVNPTSTKKDWERSNASIENFFKPLRTYVSDDYKRGLASYDSDEGLQLHLDAKSLVGTIGSLTGFVLPGMLTAGAGSLATVGTRAALKAATVAGNAAEIATLGSKLGKVGSIVEKASAATSFLQMFPGYQREGIEAGLSIRDATLLAIPMAAVNGYIESANIPALTKALGLSDDAARQAIRAVTQQEVQTAVAGLAGKPITPELLMDVAEGAAKNSLGRISRPKEMSMVGRLAGSIGRRISTGFKEQGKTEGGEEFFQSLVENVSRDLYNNFGAAKGATEGNGKFKDPTLGNYVFDATYGTLLGAAMGTAMGTAFQSGKVDPTVFGYINSDVRLQLAKGRTMDDILPRLKAGKALDQALSDGQVNQDQYEQLKSTITRMAETAAEFSDVDGFTDSDRYLMFTVGDVRQRSKADADNVQALKTEYGQITADLAGGQLTAGQQIKATLRKNELVQQLGGLASVGNQADGSSDVFAAEQFAADRQASFDKLVGQTLDQYPTAADRPAVKAFFNNNYSVWKQQYERMPRYDDPFSPRYQFDDPLTGDTLVYDDTKQFYRQLQTSGGAISQPMQVGDNGQFIPSVRADLAVDYSKPVDDVARHLALNQTLANPDDALTQTVRPFKPVDNSPEANWLRDGQDLAAQLQADASAAGQKRPKNAPDVKPLATAYLQSGQFLASDPVYGADYTALAERLTGLLGRQGGTDTASAISESMAAPTTNSAPTATVHRAALGKDLAGARPRYGYGAVNFALQFASDVDRALFVTSQTTPSKRDAEYKRFLTRLGYTNTEIAREGVNVRNAIKARAQDAAQNGAQSNDVLKMRTAIAAEPAATKTAPETPPVLTPQPNGQTPAAVDVQPTAASAPTIESNYAEEQQRSSQLAAARAAEDQLSQALDAAEQIAAEQSAGGQSDEQSATGFGDFLNQLVAAAIEARDAVGTGVDEQSADQSDVAVTAATPVNLPAGPLTMNDAVEAVSAARGEAAASQFNDDVLQLLRHPKFLQDSWLFYALPPERITPSGRVSTKRGKKNTDLRQRLPLDWFRAGAEILAGQRAQQTSPAADQLIRKFVEIFNDGGVEIDDRVSGQRVGLSLSELARTAALAEDIIPDSIEQLSPESLLAADELLAELTEDDLAALLSVVDEVETTAGDNWLRVFTEQLHTAFPPLTERIWTSIDEIVENYLDARESVIFDNGDDTDPGYQRAVNEYNTVQSGLQSALGQRPAESPVGTGSLTGSQDAAVSESSSQPGIAETLATEVAALEAAVAVQPAEQESVESAGVTSEQASTPPATNTVDAVTPFVDQPINDEEYRAFRADVAGYTMSESMKQGIARRKAENRVDNRDLMVLQNRGAELQPYIVAANQQVTAERKAQRAALADRIDDAISQAASQEPVLAQTVSLFDEQLADLADEEQRLDEELIDEESPSLAEDTQTALDTIREKKKRVRGKKIAAVETAVAALPAPVDRLSQTIAELDEEEVLLAKALNAKLKSMGSQLSANPMLDPELVSLVGQYFGLKVKKGVYQFARIARDFVAATGESMTPAKLKLLRGSYAFYRNIVDEDVAAQMDDESSLQAVTLDDINASNTAEASGPVTAEQIVASQPVHTNTSIQPETTLDSVLDHATEPQLATPVVALDTASTDQLATDIEQQTAALERAAETATTEFQRSQLINQVDGLLDQIDRVIDDVYDTSGQTEADFHERGSKAPVRKAKAACTRLAKTLAGQLGLQPTTDKKGKAIWARDNVPPAGGEIYMELWAAGEIGQRKGVQLEITFDRDYSSASGADLRSREIFVWELNEANKSNRGSNRRLPASASMAELTQAIQAKLGTYERHPDAEPAANLPGPRPARPNRDAGQIDLFGGVQPGLPAESRPKRRTARPATDAGQPGVESLPGDAAGNQVEPAGDAGNAAGVERSADPAGGSGESNAAGGTEPVAAETEPAVTPAVEPAAPAAPVIRNQNNLVIGPDTVMYPKGDTAKLKANIAAIQLVKTLQAEGRPATTAEKETLVLYTGWGGLSEVLNENRYAEWQRQQAADWPTWKSKDQSIDNWGAKNGKYHAQIVELLEPDELKAAQASTLNAHYTERGVINAMYNAAKRMGFTGGRVLEPAGGVGHFLGLMPADLAQNSDLFAVEKDVISGQIMSYLYPDADVRISGFEDIQYPNGTMDMVISNVPFGGFKLYDSANRDLSNFPIHNYFIARSARLLKPGGLSAIVTSMFTMDSTGTDFRKWLANQGEMDLVGAIRLPSSAFEGNANTSVTTDILFFQKRVGIASRFPQNVYTGTVNLAAEVNDKGERRSIDINEYYAANPDNMLGEMRFADEVGKGGLYSGDMATLYNPSSPAVIQQQLADRIATLAENIVPTDNQGDTGAISQSNQPGRGNPARGKVRISNGKVVVETYGGTVRQEVQRGDDVKIKGKMYTQLQIMTDYVAVKDAFTALRSAEQADADESLIDAARAELNRAYYGFQARYGDLNRNKAVAFIEDIDKEFSTVQSLENVVTTRMSTGRKVYTVNKADIFNKRVFYPVKMPETAATLDDALRISKSFLGEVNLARVGTLLGIEPEAVVKQAVEQGLGFVNPASGRLEMRDDYLSGNVREKLALAEQYAENDASLKPNVNALAAVIPQKVPISLISFRLGSNWIPDEIISQFIRKELDMDVAVAYDNAQHTYVLEKKDKYFGSAKNRSLGTSERDALSLIETALNQGNIRITYTEKGPDGSKVTVVDKEATAAAIAAKENLDQLFIDFGKDNHREVLEKRFNELYNSVVHKEFRMPMFKQYPGAANVITLRDHQFRAVERIKEGDTMLAHGVGTGKTFTMISAAMELRRMGIARKPMIVVQNSTVEQFRSAFKVLYPGSNAYIATSQDTETANRKRFLQRIASNDFDAVVIPMSFLKLIPNDPVREDEFTNEEIDAVQAAMDNAGDDRTASRNLVKKMQELVQKIETRRKKQADYKRDEILNFDELGVDALFLDEAHEYKRLGFTTSMSNVKGIDTAGSEQAFSALMKSRTVQAKGGRVITATGTPISNTMAEAWTIMRFISPDILKDLRLETFDQFAAGFGTVEDNFELTTTGNFKNVKRFAKFTNVGQLSHVFRERVDVVLNDDVREFKEDNTIPKLTEQTYTRKDESGQEREVTEPGFKQVILPQTDGQVQQLDWIKQQLIAFEEMSGAQKKENKHIPLVMFGLAKKATLDLRLISASNPDEAGTKTNQAVEEVLRIYEKSKGYKGTQLVFSDLYQSPADESGWFTADDTDRTNDLGYTGKRFNLFEDIRDKLIARGIPADQIAIVPDDKDKREPVFERVREGRVRILLGTSSRMGVGVNVQNLLAGLHHLDAPQRPTDFEQRNGRILRQGNMHAQMGIPVEVLTYGVDKTLDATAYQRLAIKQKFINQVLKGQITDSEVGDVSSDDDFAAMSFDQMMATLSGSQYALLFTQTQVELSKVQQAEKNWRRGIQEASNAIEHAQFNIRNRTERHEALVQNVADLNNHFNQDIDIERMKFDGKTYTSRDDWREPLQLFVNGMSQETAYVDKHGGTYPVNAIEVNGILLQLQGEMETDSRVGKRVPIIKYVWRNGDYMGGMGGKFATPQGLYSSLSSRVDGRREDLKESDLPAYIARQNEAIDEYRRKLDQPFKQADDLVRLDRELADLKQKMESEVIASMPLENQINREGTDAEMQLGQSDPAATAVAGPVQALAQQVSQAFPGVRVETNPAAYQQALIDSGAAGLLGDRALDGRQPLGFFYNDTVYLSPSATENTVLHEFGHVWEQVARTMNPDLHTQGMALVANSPYMARVNADPYYRTLPQERKLGEALAMAIGDEGVQFVKPKERMSFGGWLAGLWQSVKDALGLSRAPQRMTLTDFVREVTGQLTGGQALTDQTSGAGQQTPEATAPAFQLPPGIVPQTLQQMQADAEDRLTNVPKLAIGGGVNPDLFSTPVKEWTRADKDYVKAVAKQTGWELTAPDTLRYTRPKDLFHLADGSAVRMEGYQLNGVLKAGFQAAYTAAGNRGRLFRFVVDNMKGWTNLETFVDLLDDGLGTIGTLIKELKRMTARRSAYAQIQLEPARQRTEQLLADFSLRMGNSMDTVKTIDLETYDYDEDGQVITRQVTVPVGAAMEMALLAETQLSSYGETSHFVGQVPEATQLYKDNADGSRTRYKRGAVYYDEDADQTYYLLMNKSVLDSLRNRFENGDGAFTGETDAYTALRAYYNMQGIVNLLEEENTFLNPDEPFERVTDYYPVRTYNGQTDARQQSRGFSRTLDESRQLVARQSASDAILIRDPVTTMGDYEGAVVDILEHGRLVENMNAMLNGIETDYTGPKKDKLVSYLKARRDDLQSHRQKRAEAYEQRGFIRWLETGMQRYTQSVFSINVGLPLKQTGTYAAALGQGIIADEFLRSGEAAGTMAKLTGAAYRDWEAPSTVTGEDGKGYTGSISGVDTQERPYLEELFGEGLDDLAKQRQQQRFATVLDRMTHSQTLYTGDVEWADLGLNKGTLTNGQKMLRKFDEWNTEYGLAAMKRADRAVIIGYYTAAKLQAASEGRAAGSDDYWDRVADLTERTVYATNQMSNLTEQTPLQASTDFVAKILGLYSGQQQKLLNTVLQALNKYIKTGEGSPEAVAALKQLGATFGYSVLLNAAWVSVISAGSSALMAILGGDPPREWDETKERIGWDFLRNVAGTAPGLGSQAVEYWISQIDDRPGTDPLLQLTAAENVQTGLDIISGTANYLTEEDEAKRQKARDSVLYDVTDFTSKATGAPASLVRLGREWLTRDADDIEQ